MNEIVVISGKGGTGKTTLVAAILAYVENIVVADCDVDAPDLPVLLKGNTLLDIPFYGLKRPQLSRETCIKCNLCTEKCHFACDPVNDDSLEGCEGCGVCEYVCPTNSIVMKDAEVGRIIHKEITDGDFVYGRLIPGEETSGKLVAAVRKKAKEIAESKLVSTILVDGSPGIACNVISSVTGASHVVIVTEPTLSGLHDLKRVHELIQKFHSKITIVINKVDLSEEIAKEIRGYCETVQLDIGLEIPYNKKIVESINAFELPPRREKEFYTTINFESFLTQIDCL